MNQQDRSLKPPQRLGSAAPDSTPQLDADQTSALSREVRDLRDALAACNEREGVLRHELEHRVRNMLAVIRSVYRRSRESGASAEDVTDHFEGRLAALGRYHSRVVVAGERRVELEDLVRDELLETGSLGGANCTIVGPEVYLLEKSAEMMGLVIHELTTNSIKFGALSQDGKLLVEWSVAPALESSILRFRWFETGISAISPAPRRYGFGRQLIEEALPYQLGATATFDLKPGSIECLILLPLPSPIDASGDTDEAADLEPWPSPPESE